VSAAAHRADIVIGGVRVGVHTSSASFLGLLEERYAGFLSDPAHADYEFDVEIAAPPEGTADEDVRVYRQDGHWRIERGDFRAAFDPLARRARIRQSENPYSIDSVLRIVHTLALAREGGFLMHAASALVNGRAFLFAGVSGAGKTTISRLAPPHATLLSDEISYVRRRSDGYNAYGTPFAGELARSGENVAAPLAAVYLLEKGTENHIAAVPEAEAARAVLANVLFFAADAELVQAVFRAALDLVERVPVRRLTFAPDARVWDLIGTERFS
jgi:hypothetical protein